MVPMLFTAGLCGRQFDQPLLQEAVQVLRNGSGLRLVDPEAGLVEPGQCAGTDAADHDGIDLLAAQGPEGATGAMLVIDVAVDLFSHRPLFGID